jgi:hypothetical protein
MTVSELKEMLDRFPPDMKVLTSSVFRKNFEDIKGEPIRRFVKILHTEDIDWLQYQPLYSSQKDEADEEVLVVW